MQFFNSVPPKLNVNSIIILNFLCFQEGLFRRFFIIIHDILSNIYSEKYMKFLYQDYLYCIFTIFHRSYNFVGGVKHILLNTPHGIMINYKSIILILKQDVSTFALLLFYNLIVYVLEYILFI